jgi:hypothetical protein
MTLSEKMPTSDKLEPAAGRPADPANTQPPAADPSAPTARTPDPNAGKTFKPIAPRATATKKPGPGRPRKDAAKSSGEGDAGSAPARPGKPEVISVEAAKKLGQAAGYIIGSIECVACRIDLMQGLAIWKFSDLEKDLYAEPGARVLNKYAPEWWAEYADEIELAMALTPIFVSRLYATAMIKYPHLAEKIARVLAGEAASPKEPAKPGPELVPDQPARAEASDSEPERATYAEPIETMPRELVTR